MLPFGSGGERTLGGAPNLVAQEQPVAEGDLDKLAAEAGSEAGTGADGTRAIGNSPDYLELGQETGAKFFDVPKDVWNSMTPEEQWSANQTFLDRGIANVDTFRLATPIDEMRVPSVYADKVNYLLNNGYNLNAAGNAMVPGW